MIKTSLYIMAFSALIAGPALAQDAPSKSLQDFIPGLLLSPDQKSEMKAEEIEDMVFVSDIYMAQAVDPEELYSLYEQGEYHKTVYGLLRLARQGDPRAEETIGLMYRFGQGLKVDNAQAVRWFIRAAENQMAMSQHHLGSMYYSGQGVERNLVEAAKWMELAAKNHPEGVKREQAANDLENIRLRLSRAEQVEARARAKKFMVDHPPQ